MAQPSDLPDRKLQTDQASEIESATAEIPQTNVESLADESVGLDVDAESDALVEEALTFNPELEDEDLSPEELINAAADQFIKDEDEFKKANQLEGEELEDPLLADEGAERPLGSTEELAVRFASGLSTNAEQEERLVQRTLGPEFEVSRRGDSLFFRKKSKNPKRKGGWFKLDRDGFKGGLTEVLADVFADNSGLLAEMGSAVFTEGATIAGGARFGPQGAAAGAVAGIPLSAKVSGMFRQAILQAMGESFENADQSERFLTDTALNGATFGAGKLLLNASKSIAQGIKRTADASPKATLESLASIRRGFDQFKVGVGRGISKTKAETGQEVIDAVSRIGDDLGRDLGVIRSELAQKTGGMPVSVEGYRAKLLEVLEKNIKLPKQQAEMLAALDKGSALDKSTRKSIYQFAEESSTLGGGSDVIDFIDDIVDELQGVSKRGGLTAEEIGNKLTFWKKPSGISKVTRAPKSRPSQANVLAGNIRAALAQDELELAVKAFPDDPTKAAMLQNLKNEYAQKIDAITEFKKIFKSKGAESFTEAIIGETTKTARTRILDLKAILGEGSEEFELVRGAWMDDLFNKATNNRLGVVDPNVINKSLDKLGKESLDALLNKRQQETLRFLARKSELIPGLNLGVAKDEKMMQEFAAVVILNYQNPRGTVSVLWNLFRSNRSIAEELADDGIHRIVSSPSMLKRLGSSRAFQIVQGFRAKVDNAKRVVSGLPGKETGKSLRLLDDTDINEKTGQEFLDLIESGARRSKALQPTPNFQSGLIGASEAVEEAVGEEQQ